MGELFRFYGKFPSTTYAPPDVADYIANRALNRVPFGDGQVSYEPNLDNPEGGVLGFARYNRPGDSTFMDVPLSSMTLNADHLQNGARSANIEDRRSETFDPNSPTWRDIQRRDGWKDENPFAGEVYRALRGVLADFFRPPDD